MTLVIPNANECAWTDVFRVFIFNTEFLSGIRPHGRELYNNFSFIFIGAEFKDKEIVCFMVYLSCCCLPGDNSTA